MRNVRRSKKHEELVRLLAEDVHPDAGRSIFPSMRELMCFAAILGFQEQKRIPITGDTLDIDYRIWGSSDLALDLLFLIPLASERSLDLARPEADEQLVTIFEEYANGGFDVLNRWLEETPDDQHGDRALLVAFQKYGYLSAPKRVDTVLDQISFE
jgi:dnd system-associated protein 4